MANLDWFTGSRGKNKRLSTKTDKQLGWLDQSATGLQNNPLYQQGSNYLQQMLSNDPAAMAAFEAPYMRNFNEQIAPGLAERFAGMGTGGSGLSSSGLNNSLAQAAITLQERLAALRSGMQMNAAQQGLSYAQQPYSNMFNAANVNTFENQYVPGQEGMWKPIVTGAAGAAAGPLAAFGTQQLINQFSPNQASPSINRPGVSVG